MSNKLQELTDQLYEQGLSKGREEGERLLREAKEEARQIIALANQQASKTIDDAEKAAAALKAKAESDIKAACRQCIQAAKNDIEHLLTGALVQTEALSRPDFLKEIILVVAQRFTAEQASDIALLLPASLQSELESWVKGELGKTLSRKVSASFSKKISGGFTIGPADGSYFVSLTDETLSELLSEYLRPVTRKILFGE